MADRLSPETDTSIKPQGLSWLGSFLFWATYHPWKYRGMGLGAALLMSALLAMTWPEAFKAFDERSDSLVWNLKTQQLNERRVVMVDVDEKSVQALGDWPWSRQTMASLVDALNDYGVGLKVFDVVMPEPKDGDTSLSMALKGGGTFCGRANSLP